MSEFKLIARYTAAAIASLTVALVLFVGTTPRAAQAASLVNVTASAPIQAVGLTETWTVTGIDPLAAITTSATIGFPAGFVIPATPMVTVMGGTTPCTVTNATAVAGVVSIPISGDCSGWRGLSITIAGVTNPMVSNAYNVSVTTNAATTPAFAFPAIWSATVSTTPAGSIDADGISTAAVTFASNRSANNTGSGAAQVLAVRIDGGATIPATATGSMFTDPNRTQVTSPVTGITANVDAAITPSKPLTVTVQAPSTPGTSTVTLQATPAGGTQPVTLATTTITWRPPAVAAAPAPTARGVGPLPPAGTRGLTTASGAFELIARVAKGAGCDVDAIWANDPAGGFLTYVVGATIGAVNAAAAAAYPNGLGDNSPIIISCR